MAAKKTNKTLEQTLWEAADKLRGNQEPSEYKHVVLGLVFLKYVSDRFEERRSTLIKELREDGIDEAQFNDFLEDRDEYAGHNVFWVPEGARWHTLQDQAKQPEIGQLIDEAMQLIERENPTLRGVLPRNYGREGLDKKRLGELVDLIGTIGFGSDADHGSDDVLGSVYEYFLGQFAGKETGKEGGAFYTPRSVVQTLVEMLQPFEGRVLDPCCGSGGMFVQSAKFVDAHGGNRNQLSIYGQEFTNTTWKLAKMNLALRGIDADLGAKSADSFTKTCTPICAQISLSLTHPSISPTIGTNLSLTTPVGCTAPRARVTPTTPGSNTSSTTSRQKALLALLWRTVRSRPQMAVTLIFERNSWRPIWLTASSHCLANCSSTLQFRRACGSSPRIATIMGIAREPVKCCSSTPASSAPWSLAPAENSPTPTSLRLRIPITRGALMPTTRNTPIRLDSAK